MEIGKILRGGFNYGLFTTVAIGVPVIVAGSIYGCVKIIQTIKEHHEHKKNNIMLETDDYREV